MAPLGACGLLPQGKYKRIPNELLPRSALAGWLAGWCVRKPILRHDLLPPSGRSSCSVFSRLSLQAKRLPCRKENAGKSGSQDGRGCFKVPVVVSELSGLIFN